jgi:hypothetical protein
LSRVAPEALFRVPEFASVPELVNTPLVLLFRVPELFRVSRFSRKPLLVSVAPVQFSSDPCQFARKPALVSLP